MEAPNQLILNPNDPRVIAARDAEQHLFDFYGLEAKSRYITLPNLGLKVRITEIGEGKPLLIVPGNTGDGFPLIPLMAGLKGRCIMVLNRPGGGLSDGMDHHTIKFRTLAVQTITDTLDVLGLAQVPIVAHSIGGHWSLWMAMDKPERVSALTLLGVPGNIINTGPPFALRLLSIPGLNRFLFNLVMPKKPGSKSLKGLTFMGHSPDKVAQLPEATAECYYYFQKLPNYQVSSLSLMELGSIFGAKPENRITAEQLKQVKQPTMFLWGTNDPFGSAETGLAISKLMPNAEFHAIENGGHLPWLDEPVLCAKLTLDFLAGY